MQQNGHKCQSPKELKEWQEGWWCCFITQKKTLKEIRVMEKINEKKTKKTRKKLFVTLHKRKAST